MATRVLVSFLGLVLGPLRIAPPALPQRCRTAVEKVLGCFEKYFGAARIQKTPCDAGIQQEDMSKELGLYESGCYRSIIGLLLYLARDRVDIMFTVKELATSMSKPTLCSLQRLRKLMGYLRFTGDMGMKLAMPEFGNGKRKEGCESEWILETFTDADCLQTRLTGSRPAVQFTS